MQIKLDDKYLIRNDYGTSYVLVELKQSQSTDEDGSKEYQKSLCYGDVPHLLNHYIALKLNEDNEDKVLTVSEYLEEYKRIKFEVSHTLAILEVKE